MRESEVSGCDPMLVIERGVGWDGWITNKQNLKQWIGYAAERGGARGPSGGFADSPSSRLRNFGGVAGDRDGVRRQWGV